MLYRRWLFTFAVPVMLLASIACATAVSTTTPVSSTAASAATSSQLSQAVSASTSSASPALPQADDLTLGQDAGKVLIGLTVRPAQPGPNTLLVYVVPVEGPAAAADVPLSLS